MRLFLNEDLRDNLSDVCMRIAASHDTHMVAVCLYGPRVCGYAKEKSDVNVLVVLRRFRLGLTSHRKSVGDVDTLILTVDSGALEKDVKQGWLGEFGAEKILVPYEPLFNKDYIWR